MTKYIACDENTMKEFDSFDEAQDENADVTRLLLLQSKK